MSDHKLEALDHDPLTHLEDSPLTRHVEAGGCFTIIGPVQICWSVSGSNIKVCLRLAGLDIICQTINPQNPCVKLEGNVFCAKASVEVCLRGNCLTYSAEACYKDFPCLGGWKCTRSSGTIICF